MKIVLVLSALIALFGASEQLQIGTFETPLDHFSPTDSRLLDLTYSANVDFFNGTGPLYFYISVDIFIDTTYIQSGLVYDLARETGGALITANARYFGNNCWGNLTTESLRQLTLDQILADIPHLVVKVKEDLNAENSRVILWGYELGGTVAVLARKQFPNIVNGVWSSSGIFRADSVERELYSATARNIINYGQENCSNVLSDALHHLEELVDARDGQTLQSLFNLCAPIDFDISKEVQNFYEILFKFTGWYIVDIASIQSLCTDLVYNNDPLESFARFIRNNYGNSDGSCSDWSYKTIIKYFQDESCDATIKRRSRGYLYCTQFGIVSFITDNTTFGGIFPNVVSLEGQDEWCNDSIGDAFNRTLFERAVDNINLEHGSQNQVVSNAIFTNGNLDPYFNYDVTEYDINTSERVITQGIIGGLDLGSVNASDSSSLAQTKQAIISALNRYALPDDIERRRGSTISWLSTLIRTVTGIK